MAGTRTGTGVGARTDVTDGTLIAGLHQQIAELQAEVADLRALERQRADLIAGITHDLRSPVTAVVGFAHTISQAGDLLSPAERREALETIERQSLRISHMLDDMMASARAEASDLVPDRRVAVALHDAVGDALSGAAPAQRGRLRPDVAEVLVCGDAGQLTRVVQNLVGNALEYAPSGTPVEVVVHTEGGQGVVHVVDHGPGLPAGLDAFTRFGRGDGRGTGLGLYTVKRIVELHGGSVHMSTTAGGGTTVSVRLPLMHAGAPG